MYSDIPAMETDGKGAQASRQQTLRIISNRPRPITVLFLYSICFKYNTIETW